MAIARISQPDKNAMQSGKSKDSWLLEYEPAAPQTVEPLMGWNSMRDMTREISLRFPTKEAAIAYAQKQKLEFEVFEPKPRSQIKKAYADNFKFKKTS